MKKTKTKKREAMEVMQRGQVNEFYETLLRMRDGDDKRWSVMSPGMKLSAAMYEKNRDAVER
jgi:hypothetical protein